jgi:apolipoprotein N-acyltransferase
VLLIQIASVAGCWAVSFAVAALNGALADAVLAPELQFRHAWPLALIGAFLAFGEHRLRPQSGAFSRPLQGIRVALVQANIPQKVKTWPTAEQKRDIFQTHLDLSQQAVTRADVDLVVWPETMIPGALDDVSKDWNEEMRRRLGAFAREHHVYLLVGTTSYDITTEPMRHLNSAFLIAPDGIVYPPAARYDKLHLVPFGEYVPLGRLLSFIRPLVPYGAGFSPGSEATVFTLPRRAEPPFRFGVVICFEDAFPSVVRQFVEQNLDALINMSNEGWFGDTAELDQHVALAVYRAVEFRTSILRNTNSGITCSIAPNGHIRQVLRAQ